jgi:hypothetical protein
MGEPFHFLIFIALQRIIAFDEDQDEENRGEFLPALPGCGSGYPPVS